MEFSELTQCVKNKKSFLCVGLDPDINKLPAHFPKTLNGVADFLKTIIAVTAPYAIAYKPNFAFFEAYGLEGIALLNEVKSYIPHDTLTIADAKRGDIGNTASAYAQGILSHLAFDAITVSPYMGKDSVLPFALPNKIVVLLASTSNEGANDFQNLLTNGTPLWMQVAMKAATWLPENQLMYVMGATKAQNIAELRQKLPNYWFLVPGIGAQGGDLEAVLKAGVTSSGGLIVNASRSILYAGSGADFDVLAEREAKILQNIMAKYIH